MLPVLLLSPLLIIPAGCRTVLTSVVLGLEVEQLVRSESSLGPTGTETLPNSGTDS